MKSIGQLMKELGLRPDAPQSTAEALIKNLVKAANQAPPRPRPAEQLSFDFSKAEDSQAALDTSSRSQAPGSGSAESA
jgi:hypothetical protein